MKKTKITHRNSKQSIPDFIVTGAGIDFCKAYVKLDVAKRDRVRYLLLHDAFTPSGTDAYLWWQEGDVSARSSRYRWLREAISLEVAEAWANWAFETSLSRLSPLSVHKQILELIGVLTRLEPLAELWDRTAGSVSEPGWQA